MALPWLQIIDAAIGVTDLMRSRRIRKLSEANEEPQQFEARGPAPGALGGLEARLAGVVVAALKEAFDRDTRRLELERAQLEAEHERAERALRLELLRQAADREIGRLRLLAGVAVAAWIGTLLFSTRLVSGAAGAKVPLGLGWVLLLGGMAAAFAAQSDVAGMLDRGVVSSDPRDFRLSSIPGALAVWLIVLGLALVGLAVLIA